MKRWAAGVKRTGQPRCMHLEDSATNWLYWSAFSVSIDGSRVRTYAIVRPTSPTPGVIVNVIVL